MALLGRISSLAFLAAACGRIGFDPAHGAESDAVADGVAAGTDGASTDGAIADASGDAMPQGPFGSPTPIAPLSDPADDDDPTLTADLLELYFVRSAGQGEIFRSTRASPADPWGAPEAVAELNSPQSEDTPRIAADGLTIWFSSSRAGNTDVYTSTRPDRAAAWSAPVPVAELNTGEIESCSEPSASQLRMILCRGAAGSRSLYEAARPDAMAAWSPPVALASLNTAADQMSGFLVTDLDIWLASQRAGGVGDNDLYVARRADVASAFAPATLVGVVNSPFVDDDPWISPDGRLLVFTSGRSGDNEIWQATR